MKRSPEVTFLVVATIAMVLLAAFGIVFAEARRTATFPDGSPQHVVQSYLRAIATDQKSVAFSYVAQETGCTQQDMDAAVGVAIDRTIVQFAKLDEKRGTVGIRSELDIPSVYGGKTSIDHTFSLVREAGAWKLTGKIWPMETCGS